MSEKLKRKPIRIWVDGCFDLVHYGHANALRQAKSIGDHLVAGVISDAEVMKYKRPPVYTEEERARLVGAIKWVDEVVVGIPYYTNIQLLDKHGCDYIAHGDDAILDADGVDSYEQPKLLGRYREFKRTVGISTTDLLSRILKSIRNFDDCQLANSYPLFGARLEAMSLEHTSVHSNLPGNEGSGYRLYEESVFDGRFPKAARDDNTSATFFVPNSLSIMHFCIDKHFVEGLSEPISNDIVVYVPGTFDLFHVGHLCFFEKCLEFGTYLLVGLYSDEVSSKLPRRLGPILTMHERLLSVLSCRHVRNVLIDVPQKISATLLDNFKVDFVAVGEDTEMLRTKDGDDPYELPKKRGIFRSVKSGSSVTTTSVISRILENRLLYHANDEDNSGNILCKHKN